MPKLFIVPKKNLSVKLNKEITVKDVVDLYSSDIDVIKLEKTVVHAGKSEEAVFVISPFDVLNLITSECLGCDAELMKSDDIVVVVEDEEKRCTPARTILNIFIYIFIFLGSAMTIMYFHIDVDMLGAQKEMIRIFGKDPDKYINYIAYAYSIGLGIGMFMFFKNRKISDKKIPTPIDLKIIKYENDIVDFMAQKGNKPDD